MARRLAGRTADLALVGLALIAGAAFFNSLGSIWPLAPIDLTAPRSAVLAQARETLEQVGFDLDGYRGAVRLTVRSAELDHVESTFGRARTNDWIRDGLPLVFYRCSFKRRGVSETYRVDVHPRHGALAWRKLVEEDYAATTEDREVARGRALQVVEGSLGLDPGQLEERSASTVAHSARVTHTFGWERLLSEAPELRERITIALAGGEILRAEREVIVPGPARRAARSRAATGIALETVGFGLLAACAVGAFFVFLAALRDGRVDLRRAALWPSVVFVCLLGAIALESASLFAAWDPLWPRWVSTLRYLVFSAVQQAWLLIVLLAVVAAGDSIDRDAARPLGGALHALGRGRWLDPAVVRASAIGFPIGLLCGGAMTAALWLLSLLVDTRTAIQPRGFFFYTLNSASPPLSSLLFFLGVALAEELGYRYFCGGWLLRRTGRRWVAVLIPAVIYGLTHTRLDFLPPAEPEWGRALVLTVVGVVWGWAFLRYGALTVVLSHFTADLFIFNWPRLVSERPSVVAIAALTIAAPLLPAIGGAVRRIARRSRGRAP